MVQVLILKVEDVRPHGENLSIVRVTGGHEVVANRKEDGKFRWMRGDRAAYVPENAIVPEDVLRERGYWDEAKGKGLLGGGKGNRVKMQRFAGFESRGLLFGVDAIGGFINPSLKFKRGGRWSDDFRDGDDVAEFFGITEYVPA